MAGFPAHPHTHTQTHLRGEELKVWRVSLVFLGPRAAQLHWVASPRETALSPEEEHYLPAKNGYFFTSPRVCSRIMPCGAGK